MNRDQVRAKYEQSKADFSRLGVAVDGAAFCSEVLSDLEALWLAEDNELLTLSEAAQRSGYTSDHLRRLAREGRLPHQRRGRRLFFRAGDLPKKPQAVDDLGPQPYDPVADARQVASRRNDGATHGKEAASNP